MSMTPLALCRLLTEEGRLACVTLLLAREELEVMDLEAALDLDYKSLSRYIEPLIKGGLLEVRRDASSIRYRLHPDLPDWVRPVLRGLCDNQHNRWRVLLTSANLQPVHHRSPEIRRPVSPKS